jgi:anti-sigma regulatory factor (Ser/Thr protein kinase)
VTSATARVPADLAALGEVHGALAAALRREGWTGEPASRVLTASTEAMAKAVEHGSAPGAGIDVAVEVTARAAHVRVLDGGRPGSSTPLGAPETPPVASLRGRGRLMMRALAEEMRVRRSGSGTEVLLVFGREALAA